MAKYYIHRENLSKLWPTIQGAAPTLSGVSLHRLMMDYCDGKLPGHPHPPRTTKLGERSYNNYIRIHDPAKVTDASVIAALRAIFSEDESILILAADDPEVQIQSLPNSGIEQIKLQSEPDLGTASRIVKPEVLSINDPENPKPNRLQIFGRDGVSYLNSLPAIILIIFLIFVGYGIADLWYVPSPSVCSKYEFGDAATPLDAQTAELYRHCLALAGYWYGSLSILNFGAFSIVGGGLLALYSAHIARVSLFELILGATFTTLVYVLVVLRNVAGGVEPWSSAWISGFDFLKFAAATLVAFQVLSWRSKQDWQNTVAQGALIILLFAVVGLSVVLEEERCHEGIGCVDVWSLPDE